MVARVPLYLYHTNIWKQPIHVCFRDSEWACAMLHDKIAPPKTIFIKAEKLSLWTGPALGKITRKIWPAKRDERRLGRAASFSLESALVSLPSLIFFRVIFPTAGPVHRLDKPVQMIETHVDRLDCNLVWLIGKWNGRSNLRLRKTHTNWLEQTQSCC